MGRRLKTRKPSGPGGPASLQNTYEKHRAGSRVGAANVIAELQRRQLPPTEGNWDKVRAEIDLPTCSWRTAQREVCRDLLEAARGRSAQRHVPRRRQARELGLRTSLSVALSCIEERDEEIAQLKARIGDLERQNRAMAKGTRARRRRITQNRPMDPEVLDLID